MQSQNFFNQDEALNGTQKNIIDGVLKFYFDDITENVEPNIAIAACKAMIANVVPDNQIALFSEKNIWDSILEVRNILCHPCPQNRRVGSYSAAVGAIGLRAVDLNQLREGIIDGEVYYYLNGRGTGANHEPQGCLGLTARNDAKTKPVTKTGVVNYICRCVNKIINQQLQLLNNEEKIPSEEIPTIKSCFDNEKIITESDWNICLVKDKQNQQATIYLEGVGKNGVPFLDRYRVTAKFNEINIEANTIFPRVFNEANNSFKVFAIDQIQGKTLKALMRKAIMDFLDATNLYSLFSAETSDKDSDCSMAYALSRLQLLHIDVDFMVFRPDNHSTCSIM